MHMEQECRECIADQIRRVGELSGCEPECRRMLMRKTRRILERTPLDRTPVEASAPIYREAGEIIGTPDPLAPVKKRAIRELSNLMPDLWRRIEESAEPLKIALKLSAVGNVIDFATVPAYDLDREIREGMQRPFVRDESDLFLERLGRCRRLLVIGDNAGEHLMDLLLGRLIRRTYPTIAISYLVRGGPVINDVTLKEAREAGMQDVADLIDSGEAMPGFCYERARAEARRAYDRADLILSKGMGNFECLEPRRQGRLFFLLKIKCDVVARALGLPRGETIMSRLLPRQP